MNSDINLPKREAFLIETDPIPYFFFNFTYFFLKLRIIIPKNKF